MDESAQAIEILARTQFGILVLGFVVALVSVLWALVQFGIVKTNGKSHEEKMAEPIAREIRQLREELVPKVSKVEQGVTLLLDRSNNMPRPTTWVERK